MAGQGHNDSLRSASGLGPIKGLNYTTLMHAISAIEYLMENEKHFAGTKREFAQEMGWSDPLKKTSGRRLVEDVCNLTRDQEFYPVAHQQLGGYVIGYADNQGGIYLTDPTEATSNLNMIHLITGDLQMQVKAKTVMRRRLPMWRTVGEGAVTNGDADIARVFFQGANEISSNGFVSDSLIGDIFRVLSTRGILDA